jgi:hypothetical protein
MVRCLVVIVCLRSPLDPRSRIRRGGLGRGDDTSEDFTVIMCLRGPPKNKNEIPA